MEEYGWGKMNKKKPPIGIAEAIFKFLQLRSRRKKPPVTVTIKPIQNP